MHIYTYIYVYTYTGTRPGINSGGRSDAGLVGPHSMQANVYACGNRYRPINVTYVC